MSWSPFQALSLIVGRAQDRRPLFGPSDALEAEARALIEAVHLALVQHAAGPCHRGGSWSAWDLMVKFEFECCDRWAERGGKRLSNRWAELEISNLSLMPTDLLWGVRGARLSGRAEPRSAFPGADFRDLYRTGLITGNDGFVPTVIQPHWPTLQKLAVQLFDCRHGICL